jgi:hypothetical protein
LSHLHLRKEQTCLNCGTTITGRYCPDCGQENVEPKETAWHLIVHFFNDVTHFDGKFFTSIKYLLTKPGFLTEEYVKGRRASYLNPIRMYLFISAVFFLLLMSVFKNDSNLVKVEEEDKPRDTTVVRRALTGVARSLDSLDARLEREENDEKIRLNVGDENINITKKSDWYETVREYDSAQHALPKGERDNFITHYFTRKGIAASEYSQKNPEQMKHQIWANYYHSLPYMLFISLPLVALLFQLFYIRRKQFYYVSHGIFVIHFYCFVFIVLIFMKTFGMFGNWGNIVKVILQCWAIVYLYLAMKRFYKQGWLKTFIKYILIFSFGTTLVGLLALIFLANSFLNIG